MPFVRSVPAPGTLRSLVPSREQAEALAAPIEGLTKCNGIPWKSQDKIEHVGAARPGQLPSEIPNRTSDTPEAVQGQRGSNIASAQQSHPPHEQL